MSKLSLFSIALSLIFFGALTFLGGFLVGVWLEKPSTPQTAYAPPMAQPMYGGYPTQHISQAPYQAGTAPHHSTYGQYIPSGYSSNAGSAVQAGFSSIEIPGVPNVLHPLVEATRDAIGAGVGSEIQHGITNVRRGGTGTGTSTGGSAAPMMHTPHIPGHSSLQHSPHGAKQSRQGLDTTLAAAHKSSGKDDSKKKEDYVVQLGVFASPENANALVNHLENLNLISTVKKQKTKKGGPLYYVYSGQYDNYDLALKAASRFVNFNIPGAIVVKSPSKDKDKK